MMNNRCRCSVQLGKKPLHQRTKEKGRGTFRLNGERVKIAGYKLVCSIHGVQKVIYG